jgi:hypothetical protein
MTGPKKAKSVRLKTTPAARPQPPSRDPNHHPPLASLSRQPHPRHRGVLKIISGGQTGVDRAALDAAIDLGLAHGGWCPKGRRAEDGTIPDRYQLSELEGADYTARTRQNVLDSDGTLLLLLGELQGGSLLTWRCCQLSSQPVLIVRLLRPGPDAKVQQWLESHHIHTLNVAGPRASKFPAAYRSAHAYLLRILGKSPHS